MNIYKYMIIIIMEKADSLCLDYAKYRLPLIFLFALNVFVVI